MSLKGLSERGSEFVQYLKSGIKQGLSGNRILSSIQDATGKAYQRTVFLADMRVLRGAEETFKGLKFIRRDRLVSERHYQTTVKTMNTRYKTVVEIHGISKITGDPTDRFITVGHDTLLTRGELERAALIALEKAESPTKWDRIFPVEAYVNP